MENMAGAVVKGKGRSFQAIDMMVSSFAAGSPSVSLLSGSPLNVNSNSSRCVISLSSSRHISVFQNHKQRPAGISTLLHSPHWLWRKTNTRMAVGGNRVSGEPQSYIKRLLRHILIRKIRMVITCQAAITPVKSADLTVLIRTHCSLRRFPCLHPHPLPYGW